MHGGIEAWQGHTAAGPAELGMDLLTGQESPEEIIVLSYGMEDGMGHFYRKLKDEVDDNDAGKLLARLAAIEEKHKQMLFNLYKSFDSTMENSRQFEDEVVSGVIEGGFTTERFMEGNRSAMTTVEGILNISMMLEAQALDLYLRYSRKAFDDNIKKTLYEIAEEEKSHLNKLGHLIDERV